MIRALACVGFALVSGAVLAQSDDATPKFEIADVHVSPPSSIQMMRGGFYQGGRYELRNATMVDLIRTAWGVDAERVVGGPGWLVTDRFDVVGTAPADSTADTLKTMLQELLKDRFKLVIHSDTKDFPAYAMTVSKKPLLKLADGSEETGCKPQVSRGSNGVVTFSLVEPLMFTCRNMTMEAFANAIPTMVGASGYLNGSPVIDQTRVKGSWNFDVRFSVRLAGRIAAAGSATTIFDAFEKQLGLKLDLIKVPKPAIVVDSVNEKPTGNLPEIAEKLPAPPTEFEVASIKPTDPKTAAGPMRTGIALSAPGGRVNLPNRTLRNLIMMAWNLSMPDMIVGGPKFLDTSHFDVSAKAPTPELAPGASAVGVAYDTDAIRLMLRALLKDRFKLEVHNEDRSVSGYALLAAKPKLRKADPSNRPECKEGPGPGGKDPRTANSAASRLVTCLNVTLAQFAAELKSRAGEYLNQGPVVDATGVEGNYDITINFSPPGAGGKGGVSPTGMGDEPAAAEPNGAITLFEALQKQLGLKLETRKVAAQVLVIDHVEEKPIEK